MLAGSSRMESVRFGPTGPNGTVQFAKGPVPSKVVRFQVELKTGARSMIAKRLGGGGTNSPLPPKP